jgi:phosphatidylglycerol:prolipoprotein diacylglycerol transferase
VRLMAVLAALQFPALDPVAFRLGPLTVHWYGLAYLLAFVLAALIVQWFSRRWELGLTNDDLVSVMLAAVVGVIVGSRIGYVLVYGGESYWRDPASIVRLWDGGMSWHGGLIGLLAAGVLVSVTMRIPWLTLCDLGAIAAPIGFALGRTANFVNGELWGRVTDVPWGVVFPGAGALPRHPSQLYEALLEGIVLFGIMVVLGLKLPPRPRGELFGWFLLLYGGFRLAGEFFREPDAQLGFLLGGATMGQLLSLPLVLVGGAVIWWARKRGLPERGRAPV